MTDDQYSGGARPQRQRSVFDLADPAVRTACAKRDIADIFRLRPSGMTQRRLAELVGMSQSEVADILAGRQVKSYDVFVRIAEGLSIPRGMMGLGSGEHVEAPPRPAPARWVDEELSERVKRRNLVELGGFLLLGRPVWDGWEPPAVTDPLMDPPARISLVDVRMYEDTVTQLVALDHRVGGMASRAPLVAMATTGEQFLKAQVQPDVEERLRYAVAEAHRASAWASGDVRFMDVCRAHAHRALDLSAGSRDRIAQVLCTVSSAEKSYGETEHALQLCQLAQVAAAVSSDPQVGAVLSAESATLYHALGYTEKARQELDTARRLFAEADFAVSLPVFASYGNGHGALAAAEQQLGNYDAARAEGMAALQLRPVGEERSIALDTVILATTNVRAGELREGVAQAAQALVLVQRIGSRRVRSRLVPLADALGKRNDSTCRDLARAARKLAVA